MHACSFEYDRSGLTQFVVGYFTRSVEGRSVTVGTGIVHVRIAHNQFALSRDPYPQSRKAADSVTLPYVGADQAEITFMSGPQVGL